jgi:hypothetical protein
LFGLNFFESHFASTFFVGRFFFSETEMPRKTYVCRTCGSSEVFHHCLYPRAVTIKKAIAPKISSPQKAAVPFYSTTRVNKMTFSLLNVMCHPPWRLPKWLSLEQSDFARESPRLVQQR